MMNKRIRLRRLVRLRDVVLKNIPLGLLTMDVFCDPTDHPCGTTYCLGGWAAVDPVFKRANLRLQAYTGGDRIPVFTNEHGTATSFDALRAFFGIAYLEAVDLFAGENPNDKAYLRRKLTDLITRYRKGA